MTLPISICLIANKDNDISRCLDSVRHHVSQIVVVDTGDGSVSKIAKNYAAKIDNFEWCDDFSAARNASIALADESWIFILDSDEVLPQSAFAQIEKTIESRKAIAYNVITKNFTRHSTCTNWMPLSDDDYIAASLGFSGWFPSYKIRLFKNGNGLKFSGRVHELIRAESKQTDFFVHHLHEDEKNSEAWLNKKRYYLRLGQIKLSEIPDDPQANFELGLQFSELNMIDQAITCLKKTIDIDPDFGDRMYGNAYFEIGNIYCTNLNNSIEAEKYFQLSIKKRPAHSPSYYNLAHLYQQTGKLDEALSLYEKAIEIYPNFAVAHNNLSNLLLERKEYQKALNHARRAIELNSGISTAYQNASYALFELNQIHESIDLMLSVKDQFEKDSGFCYNMARFYYKSFNIDEAIKYLKRSIAADPKRSDGYNHLAKIYINLGLYRLTDMMFLSALSNSGRTFETLYNYSIFKIKTNLRDEAQKLMYEARAIGTESEKNRAKMTASELKIKLTEPDVKTICTGLIIGIGIQQIPDQIVQPNRMTFSSLNEFKNFVEQKYSEMYEEIAQHTIEDDTLEFAIGIFHPNIENVDSKKLTKHKFKSKNDGMIFLREYVNTLTEHAVNA